MPEKYDKIINYEFGECPFPNAVSKTGHSSQESRAASILEILLIDDNPDVAKALALAFRLAGHELTATSAPSDAYLLLARKTFDAILLDLNYSIGQSDGHEGLACLRRLLSDDPAACIIVLTAHGGMKMAVSAMQEGARDFVVKPWNNTELIGKVVKAVSENSTTPILPPPLTTVRPEAPLRLLGESPSIESLRKLIRRIGPTGASVTITGPSGAGRKLVASLLHAASADAAGAKTTIDLRDGDSLHVLQAATGTVVLRYVDQLDEIAQERLLTFLPPSVRPISIIENINELIPAARRRLATAVVKVPSLAERENDAPLLARHFIAEAASRFGLPTPALADGALTSLQSALWPDEVRGLALAVERAVLLAEGRVIDQIALKTEEADVPCDDQGKEVKPEFNLERLERAMIIRALDEHNHNVSLTASALGLSRGALYRRMERHNL